MSIIQIVTLVSEVVSLVERVFSQKKGVGAKKRARAIRLLSKTIGKGEPLDRHTANLIATLVDALGPLAGSILADNEVMQRWLAAVDLVTDTVSTVSRAVDDPTEYRAEIVAFCNHKIDIPGIDEALEGLIFGMLVDTALNGYTASNIKNHRF